MNFCNDRYEEEKLKRKYILKKLKNDKRKNILFSKRMILENIQNNNNSYVFLFTNYT